MGTRIVTAACLIAGLTLAGCKKEGPAEQAGHSIDKLGDKVQDTVDPPKGPIQATGRAIDRATGDH